MADTDKSLRELDNLFAEARAGRPALPERLAAAMVADAAAVQAGLPAAAAPLPGPERRAPAWRQLALLIGGWPALGGLAAASAAGLWIGLAPPSFLPDPVQMTGLSAADSRGAPPHDSYDLAVLLAEETQ